MSEEICVELKNNELKKKAISLGANEKGVNQFCADAKKWLKLFDRHTPIVRDDEDIEDVIDDMDAHLEYKDLKRIFSNLVDEGYKEGYMVNGREFNSCVDSDLTGYDVVRSTGEDDYKLVHVGDMAVVKDEGWKYCGRNDHVLKKVIDRARDYDELDELVDRINEYLEG